MEEIQNVQPAEDYKLILTFSDGKSKVFDMKPYLNMGIFRELQDVALFNTVRKSFDTVEWANEADIDPEILYLYSKEI